MYVYDTEYPRGLGPRRDKHVEYKALEFGTDLLILSRLSYKQNLSPENDFGKENNPFD